MSKTFLIDDILLAPVKGVAWVAEKLREHALTELTDKEKIQEELLEAQMLYEMGEITEEQYDDKEQELLTRLNEGQEVA